MHRSFKPSVRYSLLPLLFVAIFVFVQGVAADDTPPLIGISMGIDADGNYHLVGTYYAAAVRRAGGIPVYIPVTSDKDSISKTIERLDGLIMTGGADIPPEAYGQERHSTVVTMPPERFTSDQRLLKAWLETKKPLLGICLGLQQTNVLRGGTLLQDIPSCVKDNVTHRKDNGPVEHCITINAKSLLGQISNKSTAKVYSWHHQAADKIGSGLQPIARTSDGVVEAMQLNDRGFGLLVQFHPERLPDTKFSLAIFDAFIRAATMNEESEPASVMPKKKHATVGPVETR